MIRAALSGLAFLSLGLAAAEAAPPPVPPGLPDGTPETIEAYDTAAMQRHFIRWTEREAAKAVRESVKSKELMLSLGSTVRVLSFSILGDWPYTDSVGGIEQQCDYDPNSIMPFIVGTSALSAEEIAEKCYWQLRVNDARDAKSFAAKWIADFDPQRAAEYLKSLGIKPGKDLMARTIDWSGYQDPAVLGEAPTLKSRIWTSRTCDAFPAALDKVESISLGNLNIENYGTPSETAPAIAHSPWLTVTAYSINAGSKASVEFSGRAGAPATLLDAVDSIIAACEPLPAPAK